MTTPSAPDSTAVRVALWRALHVEVDPPPHVLDDTVGLRLADPDPDWRARGDMDPEGTRAFRASIVARARFLDDLVREQAAGGVGQYVILGAGLDSFAQRHSDSALQIYEVDQPGTQEWKRRRLTEEGYPLPEGLHFVPVASRVRYMLTPVDETTAAREASKPLAANASGHDWPRSKSTGTKCRPSGSG